ncbi:SRPBCC family protein [Paraburkholderia caballeronis]|uniref:Carbon monoxide dehydrogenase subunit G n=1 Tax=Paraburkholderia caballeronis TaxID=416943 RepID=A0A1H7SY21_9BURK|nr:hypothetical protein [Paraburkholderia caballeronis]PXW25701.1 hypothetical protein C7403_105384 [Paraburkholderia caballeronis]PXX01308.1 hypothetical protein C7407_105383 [Paraburkholderia caballeronis]RAJ99338.1 hypothetical protein C7409_10567 [Paraburkholderia caballeronis]SEE26305.1 hypothetical protein SAMN05445871_5044 [Paraburkholderia caballeronis]SEL76864.1 hypothetical protein SAMN05192542_11384 [Paraburkholderia caballeronis]
MKIEQSFIVPYPRDDGWQIPGAVACLPGASLAALPQDGALKRAMIVATFAGDGPMQLDDDTRRGSVSGAGVDRNSASRVDVRVDHSIRGVAKELATRLTNAFATNLKAKLDATAERTAAAAQPVADAFGATVADAPGSSPTATPASAPPPDLGKLFWKVLWARLLGGFGVARGSR